MSTKTEEILEFFANIFLVIGLLLAFVIFLFGYSEENNIYNPYGMSPMLLGFISGICIAFFTFLVYAPLKIFINISLRLQKILNIIGETKNSTTDKDILK